MVTTGVLRMKLSRDIGRHRRQFAALLGMIVLGVAFQVSLSGAMENLRVSIERPYEDLHFADFTVDFAAAPSSFAAALAPIGGVEAVEGRARIDAPATFASSGADPVAARLISLPVPSRPSVNDVLVTRGAYPSNASTLELLVEQGFADHHGLGPGDTVRFGAPSGAVTGRIAGVAISPEYLWPAKTVWEHMPDVLRRWGVFFAPYAALDAVFALNGSINEVAVAVEDGAAVDRVSGEVASALRPYGVKGITPKDKAPSEVLLRSLLSPLAVLSVLFPVFFLSIAGLSAFVVLERLLFTQRRQVGVLQALGYSRRRILRHYLGFGFVVAVLGSAIGIVLGYVVSSWVTDVFASSVTLPLLVKEAHPSTWLLGVGLSLLFLLGAAAIPAWKAARMLPVAALRGDSWGRARARPARAGRRAAAHPLRRLPFTNVARNPARSALTVFAIALAGSAVIAPLGFLDSLDSAMAAQQRVLGYDLKAVLYAPVPPPVLAAVEGWPGVAVAEPFVFATASIEAGGESIETFVYGIGGGPSTYRMFGPDGALLEPSPDGIILSAVFESKVAGVGSAVRVGQSEYRVLAFIQDFSPAAILPVASAQEFSGLGSSFNGVFVTLDGTVAEDQVKDRLFAELPTLTVQSTTKAMGDFRSMIGLFYGFIGVIIAFGIALAAAVVLNVATVTVLERSREFATLRTLGVGHRAIARVLTVEHGVLVSAGAMLAVGFGFLLTGYFVSLFSNDIVVLKPAVSPATYAASIGLLVAAMGVGQLPGLRQVFSLDLATATRERVG